MAGHGIDLGSVWSGIGLRLDGLFRGVSQAQSAMRNLDRQMTSQAEQTTRRVSLIFDGLGRTLQRLFVTGFSVYAVRRFGEALDDLAATSFRARTGLDLFARQAERAGEVVAQARLRMEGLGDELKVPVEVLTQSAAELLRIGYSIQQITDIFRGAAASGLLAGKTTVESIRLVTEALVTQRSTVLNYVGIVQNLDQAFVSYARTLGKTADELTDAERAAAAHLMITKATAAEVADLPRLLEGYGGAVAASGRAWYDLSVTLGQLVEPSFTRLRQAMANTVTALNDTLRALMGLGMAVPPYVREIERNTAETDRAIRATEALVAQYERQLSVLDRGIETLHAYAGRQALTADEADELRQALHDLAQAFPGLDQAISTTDESFRAYLATLEQYRYGVQQTLGEILAGLARVAQLKLPELEAQREQLRAALREATAELDRLRQAQQLRDPFRMTEILRSWGVQLQQGQNIFQAFTAAVQQRIDAATEDFERLSKTVTDVETQIARLKQAETDYLTFTRTGKLPTAPGTGAAGAATATAVALDAAAEAAKQARLRLQAVLEGRLAPASWADLRLMDEQAIQEATRAADQALKRAEDEIAAAAAQARLHIQAAIDGRLAPASWAELKLVDETSLQDGVRAASDVLEDAEQALSALIEQARERVQRLLAGEAVPVSWADFRMYDSSTVEAGVRAAAAWLDEQADQVAQAVTQARLALQAVLGGAADPTSWAQLKLLDAAKIDEGLRVGEEAVRKAVDEARQAVAQAVDEARQAVARAREQAQRLLAGEAVPISWAQFKLYDASTIDDGLAQAERYLEQVEAEIAGAVEQARLGLQAVLDGRLDPVSWAQLKILDASTVAEGLRAGEDAVKRAADVLQEAIRQAREQAQRLLAGEAVPTSWAALKLFDASTVQEGLNEAERQLKKFEQEFANTVQQMRMRLQLVLEGKAEPTSWAQVKLWDEATLSDGLRAGEEALRRAADEVQKAVNQAREQVQRLLSGEWVPTSWAQLKLFDQSTIDEGLAQAKQYLARVEEEFSHTIQQMRLRLQLVLEGKLDPTSWAQLKMWDEATLDEGVAAAQAKLDEIEQAVRDQVYQAQLRMQGILSGRLTPGPGTGAFRLLEGQGIDAGLLAGAEAAIREIAQATRDDLAAQRDELERLLSYYESLGAVGVDAAAEIREELERVNAQIERMPEAIQEASDGLERLAAVLAGPFAAPLARFIEDLRAFRVGERFATAFGELRRLFGVLIPDAFQTGLARVLGWLREQARLVGDWFRAGLSWLGQQASGALGSMGGALGGVAGNVLGALGSAAGAAAGALASLAGAAAGLFAVFLEASPQFKRLTSVLSQIFGDVARTVGAFLEPFIPVFQEFREAIRPILEAIRPYLRQIGEFFASLARLAIQLLMPILRMLEPILRGMLWLLNNIVIPGLNAIGKTLAALWNGIAWVVNKIIDAINFLYPFGDLITWRMETVEWKDIPTTGEGDTGGGAGDEGSAGTQISQITGPTRDLLVELLRPLTTLNILPAVGDEVKKLLASILDVLRSQLEALGNLGINAASFEIAEATVTILRATIRVESADSVSVKAQSVQVIGGSQRGFVPTTELRAMGA